MLKRQHDGYTWVFVSNTSSWAGSRFPKKISAMMKQALAKSKEWPDRDLFVVESSADSLPSLSRSERSEQDDRPQATDDRSVIVQFSMAILRRDELTALLSRPHECLDFPYSCEAPLRRSPEEDAVFCFDNHRCGLQPPRQAKDFELDMLHSISVGIHTAYDAGILCSCRHRPHTMHWPLAHSTPTKGTKTQPEKQGASNDIRPPEYRVAGPLGHEIVSRSQKRSARSSYRKSERNPPRKEGRSR